MLARELSVQYSLTGLGSGRRWTKLQFNFNTTRACEVIHCELIKYYLNGFLNNKLSVNVYIRFSYSNLNITYICSLFYSCRLSHWFLESYFEKRHQHLHRSSSEEFIRLGRISRETKERKRSTWCWAAVKNGTKREAWRSSRDNTEQHRFDLQLTGKSDCYNLFQNDSYVLYCHAIMGFVKMWKNLKEIKE